MGFRHSFDARVGDRDAIGITAKIFDRIAHAVKCLLDERAPVFCIEDIDKGLPAGTGRGLIAGIGDVQNIPKVQLLEMIKEFSAELLRQDTYWDEEIFSATFQFQVFGQARTGNDAVHVGMIVQLLSPGVEHLNDARGGTEVFRICRQFQECLGCTAVQQGVHQLLVGQEERVQFVRNRKNHMEIGRIDHFTAACIDPDFLEDRLTVWAVAVAAGIVVDPDISAF